MKRVVEKPKTKLQIETCVLRAAIQIPSCHLRTRLHSQIEHDASGYLPIPPDTSQGYCAHWREHTEKSNERTERYGKTWKDMKMTKDTKGAETSSNLFL